MVRDRFEHLTPLFPQENSTLQISKVLFPQELFTLLLSKRATWNDRFATKTGKTMLLKDIANAIAANHPEVYQIVLLLTNARRSYRYATKRSW